MATPLYDALVTKVRDWANRDSETLPDAIIQDSLRYAADIVYRELKVPALEATATYTITSDNEGENALNIPEDLTEFISFRRTDPSDITGVMRNIVYNQKADYRTFNDITAEQYNFYRWTRKEHQILVHPEFDGNETYELFYYRRLPALNGTYEVSAANYALDYLTEDATGEALWFVVGVSEIAYDTAAEAEAADTDGVGIESRTFVGNEAPQWLRDEQEKILLWGALANVFDYLGEDQMMQKYTQRFQQEIQLLNKEEGRRKVSGGNTQQNFDGYLI